MYAQFAEISVNCACNTIYGNFDAQFAEIRMHQIFYVLLQVKDRIVNFLDSEAQKMLLLHKNGRMDRFGRKGKRALAIL